MINHILWGTGLIVWLGLGVLLARMGYEILVAVVVAADLVRWSLRCVRLEKMSYAWWEPLRMGAYYSWQFTLDGHTSVKFARAAGEWGGFRKGTFYAGYTPKEASDEEQ